MRTCMNFLAEKLCRVNSSVRARVASSNQLSACQRFIVLAWLEPNRQPAVPHARDIYGRVNEQQILMVCIGLFWIRGCVLGLRTRSTQTGSTYCKSSVCTAVHGRGESAMNLPVAMPYVVRKTRLERYGAHVNLRYKGVRIRCAPFHRPMEPPTTKHHC